MKRALEWNGVELRAAQDAVRFGREGIKGFPDAIPPPSRAPSCRPALRAVYRAETAEIAKLRLGEFEAAWGKKYPAIEPAWWRAWNEVTPFFAYPPQIRKIIYTTNAIESLYRGLRKVIKTRASSHQTKPPQSCSTWPAIEWRAAYAQFAIFFPERLPTTIR